MKLELVATCLFGLEKLLGEEIDALGYERTETIDGRVTFIGDERAIYRANLHLRFAERVFINMGEFKAVTFEELFQGVYKLDWENYLPVAPNKFHLVYFRLSGELWQSLELVRFTDGDFSVKLDYISGPVV